MAKATIGVSAQTKRSLAAAKPRDMPWDGFMVSLLESSDPTRFVTLLEAKQGETEEDAVERAKQRYMKYRKNPDALLSSSELRRRIHLRRLLESLSSVRGSLQLANASPDKGDTKALRELLDDLDGQIHEARDLLRVS